jgi:hypothetical protein
MRCKLIVVLDVYVRACEGVCELGKVSCSILGKVASMSLPFYDSLSKEK